MEVVMAPPVTPSPHRFLPLSSKGSQSRTQPPASAARNPPAHLSQQFRATPRFAAPPSSIRIEPIESPASSPITPRARQLPHIDQNGNDHELNSPDIHMGNTDEHRSPHQEDDDLLADMLLPSKRKRLTQSPTPERTCTNQYNCERNLVVLSSSPPMGRSSPPSPIGPDTDLIHPQEHLSDLADYVHSASRFQLTGSKQPQTPAAPRIGDENAPLLKTSRPGFVLPAQADEVVETSVLPDVFSPHKKGSRRFIANGMASTLQGWVLDLESTQTKHTFPNSGKKRIQRLDQANQITVCSVNGASSGVWNVVATNSEQWVLIGARGYGSADARAISIGSQIIVKPPLWAVEIEGQRWGVAVFWVSIS